MLCLARKSGAGFTGASPPSPAVAGSMPNRPDCRLGALDRTASICHSRRSGHKSFLSLGDWRRALGYAAAIHGRGINAAGSSHRIIAQVSNLVPEGQFMQQSSCRIAPRQRESNFELPPPDTKRWSSRRKAAVVVATRTGILSRVEACQRYMLSNEELADCGRWRSIDGAFRASAARLSTSTAIARNRPSNLFRSASARSDLRSSESTIHVQLEPFPPMHCN
jgi:hypothetical protein